MTSSDEELCRLFREGVTTTITCKGDGVMFPYRFDVKLHFQDDVITWEFVDKEANASFPCHVLQPDKIFFGSEHDIVASPVFYKDETMFANFLSLPRYCKVFYCLVS